MTGSQSQVQPVYGWANLNTFLHSMQEVQHSARIGNELELGLGYDNWYTVLVTYLLPSEFVSDITSS